MSYFLTGDSFDCENENENGNCENVIPPPPPPLLDNFSILVSNFNEICPYPKYMVLSLFIDHGNAEFKSIYANHINSHNQKLCQNIDFMDAGFDLLVPVPFDDNDFGIIQCENKRVNKIDFQVKCAAKMYVNNSSKNYNTGFYMYPRSSISKSCIRMANNVGIIDAGYRGRLMGMVDVLYEDEYNVLPYDRYFQICAPELVPVIVKLVDYEYELGQPTSRGSGGFGSTGV